MKAKKVNIKKHWTIARRKKQTPDITPKPYRCPKCKQISIIENKDIQSAVFSCPNCGQKNIFKKPVEQQEKKHVTTQKTNSLLSQISLNAVIIGLILILISISLLFKQNPLNIKLSITLIILGIICPLFIIEKKQNISMQITLGTIIYIIILFLATGTDLEIFLILIFLGVLVTKTVIDEYIPAELKTRMNLFIIVFFAIFSIIVIQRIINLIGI